MNIWFRIGDTLVTPELSDSILGGITRKSIIKLAENKGIKVEQRKILISEVVEAYKNGSLKESFGTGTAVTVNPIKSITFEGNRMEIINQEDSYAQLLKQELQGIQKGKIEDIYNWTSKVSKFRFNFIL
jgi:branched-chain amino acid aminotransferase